MKIKNYLILSLIAFGLNSCKNEVDKTDPFKVAEAIHKGFVKNDSTILKSLFAYRMDSLSVTAKKNFTEAKKYFNKNQDVNIIKIDTSTMGGITRILREEKEKNIKIISVYFGNKDKFSHMELWYPQDSTQYIKIKGLLFSDINTACENDNNTPYKPVNQINFKRLIWKTDYSNTIFQYGAVEIQNNTQTDIDFIKFRVIIKKGNSEWNAETFINQTVESRNKIYAGDIAKIEVPNMEDYYAGFRVNKDNLFFHGELIEIRPKPKSFWCEKLDELTNKEIKK